MIIMKTRILRFTARALILLLCTFASAYVSADSTQQNKATIELKRVFETATLSRPLALIELPLNTSELEGDVNTAARTWYVLEQAGRVLRLEQVGSNLKSTVLVDIRNRVESGPNEAGLLGMAVDPNFLQNGRVYLSYTREGSPLVSVLARYVSRDGGRTLVVNSEKILLEVDQPYSNHNGGNIHFGPDGYLYYGLGDGGSAGDPKGNGQNTQTLLGSLLRLDVSGPGLINTGLKNSDLKKNAAYQVPADNPFAKGDGRPEIFAYGLRNPWRWSFDRTTGDLWLADVGQNIWEEVNIISRGGNYGWNLREGAHCYSGDCRKPRLIEPVAEYSHDDGCSVTGGYVYRGDAVPALKGVYLFGDYCSGKIWGLFSKGDGVYDQQLLIKSGLNIASFAEDQSGEIYVLDLGGKIFKISAGMSKEITTGN